MHDDPITSPPAERPAANAVSELLAGVKGLVVWVGASVAGLSAMLYACGFLVARAQATMLGLSGVVDFGADYYLHEGAKFIASVGFLVGLYALPILLPLAIGVATPLAIFTALQFFRERNGRERLRLDVPAYLRADQRLRGIAFVLLLAALFRFEDSALQRLEAPISIRNLLYAGTGTTSASASRAVSATDCADRTGYDAQCLTALLLAGDTKEVSDAFLDLVGMVCATVLLTLIAWRLALPWPARAWVMIPFVASLALNLLALPMDYGVLRRSRLYPKVTLTAKDGASLPAAGKPFLLSITGDTLVVWDAASRRVTWIPAKQIGYADIGGVADLFQPAGAPP